MAAPTGSSAVVEAFDSFTTQCLAPFVATSKKIGGKAEQLGAAVQEAFQAERSVLVMASECKKPAGAEYMGELNKAMTKVGGFKERDAFENQAKACAEGIPALAWVMPNIPGTAGQYVTDMAEASVFYLNKVRQEHKGKEGGEAHVQWCKELDGLFRGLATFVKENQPTGLAWNPKGKEASGAPAPSASAAPVSAALPAAAAAGSNAVNLFAELSKIDQSSGKTAGLKHVTKDMKKKDPDAAPVVKAASSKKKEEPAPKVQVFALQGNKWVVEGQTSTVTIAADQLSVKHTVYVYNCVGATVIIEGKCNTITVDGCKNTSIVFQDVLAMCETVNSKNIKVQCKGKSPTISIDKTDGMVVYLSRAAMFETKIVVSKSSEMNVSFPGATDDDAWIEKVIPEQFVHHVLPNNTVSAEVSDLYSHGG